MADTFQLEVATPERELVREDVSEAQLPGKDGYIGILPGHAPLLGALGAGVLTFHTGGQEHRFAVDGGFIEVSDNHVSVLADHAEAASDIKVDTARQQLEGAKQDLSNAKTEQESDSALLKLRKAQARIDAAENYGSS